MGCFHSQVKMSQGAPTQMVHLEKLISAIGHWDWAPPN